MQLKIEYITIDKLIPYVNNPRKNDKAVDIVAGSIKEFGFKNPIIVDKDNVIIAGHTRFLAGKKLELGEVPIIRAEDLTEQQIKAFRIADNKTAEFTTWDTELLALELEGLEDIFTGFDAAEIEHLFSQVYDKDVKEDDFDVDEALKEPVISKPGDLWLLGRHRLLCGDSTKAETYEKLMDGKKANLVVTDPPYNIDIQGGTKDKLKIKNDKMSDREFYEFLLKFYKCTYDVMDDGAAIYVFHADTEGINFRTAFRDAGFHLSAVCVWVKNSLVLSRGDFHFRHEPVIYGWKPTGKHKWYADRKQDTIWEFDRPKRSESHPTTKPIPLVAYPIKNSSMTNCIVLDPFSGSFSTGIACEQLDRICYAIELDEKYADVGVKRFIDYVGSDDDVHLIRDGVKTPYKKLEIPT